MPSSLADGPVQKLFRISKKLSLLAGAVIHLTPQANPASCSKGDLNVGTDGKLYVCSADNTWTVAGTQA